MKPVQVRLSYITTLILLGLSTCVTLPLRAQTMKASDEKWSLTFRLGQGGFTDSRSPLGQLGGGQIALDVKPAGRRWALSLTGEYYTNSAAPSHRYEISDLTALNLLYMAPWRHPRLTFFAGGGPGLLAIPRSEDNPDELDRSFCVNLESGLRYRLLWKLEFYGMAKYLYARKTYAARSDLAFNEFIVMIGISFNFLF